MGGINAGGRFNTHTHTHTHVTMCKWAGGGSSDVRRKPVIRDTAVMVVVRAEIETCPTAFFYNNSKSYVYCGTYTKGVMEFALSSGCR